jgi:hypothetical protein
MAYSNVWLSEWSTKATEEERSPAGPQKSTTDKYLMGYGGLGAGQGTSAFIKSSRIAKGLRFF